MVTMRQWGREIGTALAVLALYLLTILAPLHQARASQLAFQDLGYETVATGWVLCTPDGAQSDDPHTPPLSKCPAAGIGNAAAPPPPGAVLPVDFSAVLAVRAPQGRDATPAPPSLPPLGQRAPPASV